MWSTALGDEEPMDTNGSEPCPPYTPPCQDKCSCDGGSGAPAGGGNPVDLVLGMLRESETDLQVPGVGAAAWSHSRSYMSFVYYEDAEEEDAQWLPTNGNPPDHAYIQGKNWEVPSGGSRVSFWDTVAFADRHNYIDIHRSFAQGIQFKKSDSTGKNDRVREYASDFHPWRMTLTHYKAINEEVGTEFVKDTTGGSTTTAIFSNLPAEVRMGDVVRFSDGVHVNTECELTAVDHGTDVVTWSAALASAVSSGDSVQFVKQYTAATGSTSSSIDFDPDPVLAADDLTGCFLIIVSGTHVGEIVPITDHTVSGATSTVTWDTALASVITAGDKFRIGDRVVLTEKDTKKNIEYAGFSATWSKHQQKLVISDRDAYGNGLTYFYDPTFFSKTGRVTSAVTSDGYEINYSYITDTSNVNIGKISKIEVENPSDQVIQKVEYWYQGSDPDYECGSNGDLILVKISKRGSADSLAGSTFSIEEYTHYRYYTDATTQEGDEHQIKMILDNDDFQRLMADKSKTDEEILELVDTANGGSGDPVEDYASRDFTYYTADFDTHVDKDTPWGGTQDLGALYASSSFGNFNETGMVKEETIYTGCGSCGGTSGSPIRYSFFYMGDDKSGVTEYSQYPTTYVDNRLVVEDKMAQDGSGDYTVKIARTIKTIDNHFRLKAQIRAEDVGGGSTKYWAENWSYFTSGSVDFNGNLESHTMPSVWSAAVTTDAQAESFLAGSISQPDQGLVESYTYTADGYQEGSLVAEGTGTAYLTGHTKWGDGTTPDQPKHLPIERYRYAEQKTAANYTQGDKTTYAYTFWDDADTQIKTRKTTYPIVTTGENGSGSASEMWEYFDTMGRLRWMKDANGRTTYRSYHPVTGDLAYEAVDVDTSDLSTDIENGSSGLWVAWDNVDSSNDDSVPSDLQSSGTDFRAIVTKREYDDLGRMIKTVDPEGAVTYIAYGDDIRIVFPHWDASAGEPLLPILVTETDEGDRVTETYTVDPTSAAIQVTSGVPVGFSTAPAQSLYTTWTVNTYNVGGQLVFSDWYFNIPSSGTGNASDNYYRTAMLYDEQGRKEYTIQAVSGSPGSSGVEQVTQNVYDVLDRVTEIKQGVSDASHSVTLSYNAIPTTLKTVEKIYFDGADSAAPANLVKVGDGHQTRVETYFADGTTESHRTTVLYHHDYRGRLRGVESEVAPYTVMDLDWSGSVLAQGLFTTAPGSWTGLADDYAEDTTSGRGALATTEYDSWGRPFRSLQHGIVFSSGAKSKAIESLTFYDTAGNMVAQAITGRGGTEYAYDGANRQYQTRTVSQLSGQDGGSYFTSEVFNYQSPTPRPALGNMTGGDDHVLALDHSALDADGKGLSQYHWAVEHGDAGLLVSTPDYIQTTIHFWYDDADRLIASAAYGTNNAGGAYEYASAPIRVTAPTASTDTVLLTQQTYETATGRMQDVVAPLGSGGSASTQTSRTIYDDLGRSIASIENYDNATVTPGSPATVANSGGATTDLDRVTVYQYNGLGQVAVLTAVDPDGDGNVSTNDNQDTLYLYEDTVNAAWLTHTIYPDSTDTTSSGYDQVARTYHLDGSVGTLTKQKKLFGDTATVITFDYDDARRPSAQRVTTVGTDVDDAMRAVVTIYDGLGRPSSQRTYAESSPVVGTDTPLSDVAMTYGDYGELLHAAQSHDDEATTGTPEVAYEYDTTDTGADGVLDHALRPLGMTYPNGREIAYDYSGHGGIDALISRPGGIIEKTIGTLVDFDDPIVSYEYLGDGTLAVKDYPAASLRLDRYGQTAGTYAGYDRFGRIKQQRWETYNGSEAAVFDIAHDYDQASNRLNAVRSVYPLASQAYTHDGLNRLASYEAGEYDDTADEVEDLRKFDRQLWDLDQLGNQLSVASLEDPASDTNPYTASTFNDANEISTRSVQATERVIALDEFDDASTASLWEGISGASFTVDSGDNEQLGTSDTAVKVILFSEESTGSAAVSTLARPITANQTSGLVFGYHTDTGNYYRVVFSRDGTCSLESSSSGTLATTSTTGLLKGYVKITAVITERGVTCYFQEGGDPAGRGGGDGNDSAILTYAFPKGSPTGRVGVYTDPNADSTAINFDNFVWTEGARAIPLGDAWENHADNISIKTSVDHLVLDGYASLSQRPVLLRGVTGDRFRADFEVYKSDDVTQKLRFHFNAQDPEDSDYLVIPLVDGSGQGEAPLGYEMEQGALPLLLSATEDDTKTVDWGAGESYWIRVESDGTDLKVYQASSTAGLDTKVSNGDHCFETSGVTDRFEMSGGQIGFAADTGDPEIVEVKVYLDLNADDDFGDANEWQHTDTFTLDVNGYGDTTFEYDAAGNLTYDGVFRYVYDAWNRLVEVRKAASSSVDGATIATYGYDALGRRVTRSIQNSGDATITYHDYWSSGWQLLETHDASENVLKQHVWGLEYIDELIQIAVNRDVYIDTTEDQCEQVYFALQDAHYNVIGLATAGGHLVERYEYTPYGERKVYSQPQPLADLDGDGGIGQADYDLYVLNNGDSTAAGTDIMYMDLDGSGIVSQSELDAVLFGWGLGYAEDDKVTRGMGRSASVENRDGLLPFAINDVGHQGLYHDNETSLIYNRARYRDSELGRWLEREPLEYFIMVGIPAGPGILGQSQVDEILMVYMNMYGYVGNRPFSYSDPTGEWWQVVVAIVVITAKLTPKIIKAIKKAKKLKKLKKLKKQKKAAQITKCSAIHSSYKSLGCKGCKGVKCPDEAQKRAACLAAEVAGRSLWLSNRCDYVMAGSIARGSKTAESGHRAQLKEKAAALARCTAIASGN